MITEYLENERQRLESLMLSANDDIESAPEGSLRITHTDGKVRFRHKVSTKDRSGTYLRKDQLPIAMALAQKAYADQFIKNITPKMDMINSLIREYEDNSPESAYFKENVARQQLIKPYIISDEEYARNWLAQPFEPNPKHPENRTHETANGEKVRSKSEVIIADNLKMLGIPYKYEAPVTLDNTEKGTKAITVYPDFTCLNIKRRKVIYLEHFGKMDDPDYRHKEFFWKLKNYEAAGLIQGKNLLMTFEDDNHHLNFNNYELAIEELLLN